MRHLQYCMTTCRRRATLLAVVTGGFVVLVTLLLADQITETTTTTMNPADMLLLAPSNSPTETVAPSAPRPPTIASVGGMLGGFTDAHEMGKKQQQPKRTPLRCSMDWAGPPRSERYLWHDPGKDRYTTSGCPLYQKNIRCSAGSKRHRALVLYMIHTKDNPHDMQQEMWNLNHFVRFGIYGANESTAMFERVDYIFTRMRPNASRVTSVQLCGQASNIRMFWVPDGPCDLCAHGRVIEFLGGHEKVKRAYNFLLMTNAGSRGPLQHQDAPQWLDVFAMGGQTSWTEKTPPMMVGPSIKPYPIHVESHVIGISTRLLAQHMQFLTVHCNGTKLHCITKGEHRAGPSWLSSGGWLHSLSRNVTIRNHTREATPYRQLNSKYRVRQPLREFYDVCAALFAKHGGSFMNSTMLKERTAAHTAQLTMHQSPKRQLGGGDVFRNLLGMCNFIEL
jgi:hypothetical protein